MFPDTSEDGSGDGSDREAQLYRSGRWLIVFVVLVVALAVLLPLASQALRELVALTG